MSRKYLMSITVTLTELTCASWAAAQEQDIRDVRGPVAYPVDLFWAYAGSGILLFCLVLLLAAMLRKYADNPRFKKKKIKRPWELAADQLAQLLKKDYIKTEKFGLFYTELSGILRTYLENNFSIRAPEMTTEEFLVFIRDNQILFDQQKELLGRFLSYADMVKFAKLAPTRKGAEESFELAREFVEQTKKD